MALNFKGITAYPYGLEVARIELEGGFSLLDSCLLYTSDAADERSSVDLGGRRIIKKKKTDDRFEHRYMTTTKYIQLINNNKW